MKVAFRTDASIDIGTGHVMRCLTLAATLRDAGASCHFICREHQGNLLPKIREQGFEVTALPAGMPMPATPLALYSGWLGADWEIDSKQTRAALLSTPDWLIVDHYAIERTWEHSMRNACHGLMVIDDLANRLHDCDILLDQNLARAMVDYAGLVPAECTILAGPHYAMLRPEFSAYRMHSIALRKQFSMQHILISMGGVDKENATGKVLQALRDCALPSECQIIVVLGPHAPALAEVSKLAATMPWPTEVRCNVENMAVLMAESDFAIGAAGSTSWERCALGLPSIMVVIAENQSAIADALEAAGAAKKMSIHTLQTELKEFFADTSTCVKNLAAYSKQGQNITDGQGVKIVTQALLSKVPA